MKIFKSVLIFELSRRFRTREIILFLLIAFTLLFFVHHGKNKYFEANENKKIFQDAENTKVKQYVLYRQYGGFGIRLMFMPSPYSILYNDHIFDGLLAHINTVERQNIYKPVKGKNFFTGRSEYMCFAGIILLFGSLVSIIYGYDTGNNRTFSYFLSSISDPRKIFIFTVISRIIILNIGFLILIGISILTLLFNNINLFGSSLALIIIVVESLLTFFFAIGCIIGSLKKSIKGIVLTIVFFLSVFIIPFIDETVNEVKSSDIDNILRFELVNLKIIMSAEKRLLSRFGVLRAGEKPPPEVAEEVKKAVNDEHKKIRKRENQMRDKVLERIKNRHLRSLFFPVLFYNSIMREISSHGGLSLIDFYSFSQKVKKEFIDFYVNKRFLTKSIPGQIENFVKGEENIFYAESKIPEMFWQGIIITLIYTVIGLIIA